VGGGRPGKYLLGDWWVGEELEESQRFCLEPALLVDEGRGTEVGARRGEKEGLAGADDPSQGHWLRQKVLTVQLRRSCTGVPAPLPNPATGGGETAPGGVTVVLITLPLESHNSPSVTRTIPPATGLFPPPVYRL